MEIIIHTTVGGISFQFQESANKALGAYLAEIRKHLSDRQDASEIAEDIEARVAEVLLEVNGGSTTVITDEVVSIVIERIGKPSEIDFGAGPDATERTVQNERYTRRLYRDGSNSVFAGVCSGLGVYFNSDPILFRVAFLLLFFIPMFGHHHHMGNGFSILLYAILWVVIPKAKTHRQLMEMHGKSFDLNSVKENVAKEFKDAASSMKTRTGHDGFMERLGLFFGELFFVVGKVFKVLFGLFSLVFIVIGVSLIALLFGVMFFDAGNLVTGASQHCNIYIQELASIFIGTDGFWGMTIPATIMVLIPTLGLIYVGLRLAFKFRSSDRLIGFTALGLWLAALVVGAVYSFSEIKDFQKSSWVKTVQPISIQRVDTLVIQAVEMDRIEGSCNFDSDDDNDQPFYLGADGKTLLRMATLNLENGKTQPLSAWVDQFSMGETKDEANKNAQRVDISVALQGNELNLDPVITFTKNNKWRFQKGCVNLSIPEGTVILFDANTKKLLDNSPNSHTYVSGYMSGKYYEMTDNGLKEIAKKE